MRLFSKTTPNDSVVYAIDEKLVNDKNPAFSVRLRQILPDGQRVIGWFKDTVQAVEEKKRYEAQEAKRMLKENALNS